MIPRKMWTKQSNCAVKFVTDFIKTFLYYFQCSVSFTLHLFFHFIEKSIYYTRQYVIPGIQDFIHETKFFLMITLQGFCEIMALGCISMSGMFIQLGKFFHNQSEKLVRKCGW